MWVRIFPEYKTHQKNLKSEVLIFFRYRYKQVTDKQNKRKIKWGFMFCQK
jgi:hypothetical protein